MLPTRCPSHDQRGATCQKRRKATTSRFRTIAVSWLLGLVLRDKLFGSFRRDAVNCQSSTYDFDDAAWLRAG
jgi:hypothetical protein